jgi:Aspartyl protease
MKNVKIKLKRIDLGEEGCHLFCKGKIQGKPIRILIDTGASKSVIGMKLSSELADLLPVEVRENETSGIGPEKVVTEFAQLNKLRLGNLVIKDLVVGIVDFSHVNELYDNLGYKPFDMILGGEILYKHKANIDYKKGLLTLRTI